MTDNHLFFTRTLRFTIRKATTFIFVCLLAITSCNKNGKTFLPPVSDSARNEILTDVREIGDEYKSYAIGNTRTQIKITELSITVENNLKTFMEASNGTLFTVELKPIERTKVTELFIGSAKAYLQRNFNISENAQYKILILIYGGNSVNFDSNQNASGELDAQVLFLDTKSKLILWHADTSGSARDVMGAAQYASSGINEKLDVLFRLKKD
jgi:hypothetical protein